MTKTTLALALAAALGSASVAAANVSYFGLDAQQEAASVLDLGLVRSADDATVEIYDFFRGEPGALLGTKAVNAGVNGDVQVNLQARPINDVLAVLKSGDTVLATKKIEFIR